MAGTFVQYTPATQSSLSLAPSGSASAPSYSFSAQSNLGFYRSASNELSLAIAGSQYFVWGDSGFGGGFFRIPSEVGGLLVGGNLADPGNSLNTIMAASSAYNASVVAKVTSATAAASPLLKMFRGRGTLAVPTAITTNDQFGVVSWNGHNGTTFVEGCGINSIATGVWSAAGTPSDMIFRSVNTVSGVATFTEAMKISSGTFNVQVSAGNFIINTAGKGLQVKSGSNARIGSATLVAGTVVVSNTSVAAGTLVFLSVSTAGGTQGFLSSTKSNGVSFTITSTSNTDTSVVNWLLVESI